MKFALLVIAIALVGLILGCSDSTEPGSQIGHYIQFHGKAYNYDEVEVSVSGTDGGPVEYSLHVNFSNSGENLFAFGIQDLDNNPINLLTEGEHFATGQHWDSFSNYLTEAHFSIGYLNENQASLVWNKIEIDDRIFSGHGYIHIKQRLELACADSIWVGGEFAGPGHPAYEKYYETYCEPEYFYPEQKIYFSCKNGWF